MRTCTLDICPFEVEGNPCCADCDRKDDCKAICEHSEDANKLGCDKVLQ